MLFVVSFLASVFGRLCLFSSAFSPDAGDTNEACYGLHNIVFEIIINLRAQEFHLTERKGWRAETNNGIPNGFS